MNILVVPSTVYACRTIVIITLVVFILLVSFSVSACWNFTGVNLPDNVFISKFAVWKNRAFLAIPRLHKNSHVRATLLEVPWPESTANSFEAAVNGAFLSLSNSSVPIDKRESLRSVAGLDVDNRGRLWVLDVPDKLDCCARIVVRDLRRNDQQIVSAELTDVPVKDLKTLAVDPIIGQWGSRAYIGDPGDESIITYSLGQHKWWRIKLAHGPGFPRVFSTDIAISRKTSILYMTGHETHELFGIDLDDLRNDEGPPAAFKDRTENVRVSWLGTKLGSSFGMFCDWKGGLHYFLTSEGASVRWDAKYKLTAESHSILLQREDVPCITDYAMDKRRSVWALVNSECSYTAKRNHSRESRLKFRTIKIFK